jgi:hypothetical protein
MRGVVVVAAWLAAAAHAQPSIAPPAVPPDKAAKPIARIALVNAGFESANAGKLGAPEGWWAVQHAGPESYRFRLDDAVRHEGGRSLRVENVGSEPYGMIYQPLDAAPYRGKTVRFAAWIRSENAAGNRFGKGAGLHLQTLRRGFPLDVASMRRNAVHGTTDWTRYEVVLAVGSEADQIEVGMNLFGPGIAWIDGTTLDVVEPGAGASR